MIKNVKIRIFYYFIMEPAFSPLFFPFNNECMAEMNMMISVMICIKRASSFIHHYFCFISVHVNTVKQTNDIVGL